MKNIYLLFIVIAGSWLINSCSDIVDSESNKRITILEYSSIKADQEHDVIMPLKVGNKWYYNVTEFKPAGTIYAQYLDSIEVIKEINLDGERWFEVNFPPMGKVYMANTNLGLWVKCMNCTDVSYLEAKYPDINETFYSGYMLGNFLVDTLGEPKIVSDSVIIWKKSLSDHIVVSDSGFDCVKYTGWLEGTKLSISELPYCNYWYVPNFGLVRYDYLQTTSDGISRSYNWILKPKLASEDLTRKCFDIDFGTLKSSEINAKDTVVQIFDKFNKKYTITSLKITGNNSNEFSISNTSILPIIVNADNIIDFTFRFKPGSPGAKNAVLTVGTSEGDFVITLHGISE